MRDQFGRALCEMCIRDSNKTMRQAMMLTVGMSVVIAALGLAFAEPIIWFMGAQADTIGPGTDYFRVQCYGLLATTLSLAIKMCIRDSCYDCAPRSAGQASLFC